MDVKTSINALVEKIKVVLSKEGGRFTADDIAVLESVCRQLEKLGKKRRRKVDKKEVLEIVCQLIKFFLSKEIFDRIRDFFK